MLKTHQLVKHVALILIYIDRISPAVKSCRQTFSTCLRKAGKKKLPCPIKAMWNHIALMCAEKCEKSQIVLLLLTMRRKC